MERGVGRDAERACGREDLARVLCEVAHEVIGVLHPLAPRSRQPARGSAGGRRGRGGAAGAGGGAGGDAKHGQEGEEAAEAGDSEPQPPGCRGSRRCCSRRDRGRHRRRPWARPRCRARRAHVGGAGLLLWKR